MLLPIPTILFAVWVISVWKFSGLYGQDPFAYYDFGVGPLRRFVLDGTPLTPLFWPLGYPVLITLSSLVLGPVTTAAQVVNVLASAAAVCLTYLLGRDLLAQAGASPRLGGRAGALGALLLGMTGRLVESSVLIMADAVALSTALLSAWALVRWSADEEDPDSTHRPVPRGHWAWLALSATALAWSVVTRWGQVVLVFAWLIASMPTVQVRRWRALPCALIPAAAVLGAQFWLVFTVRPEADLGAFPFAGDLALVNGGSGWSLLHLFQNHFVTPDGAQGYTWPNAVFYATGAFLPQYLTPIFFPAVLLGFVTAAMTYRRALLLLLSWPTLLLLVDAGLAEQNPRFILAALPPIAILAGLGLAVTWARLQPQLRPLAAALLAAALLVVATFAWRELRALNSEQIGDLQVSTWTAARLPAHATTLSFAITLTLQHATNLHVLDLSVLSERDLQRLILHRHPLYLLVQLGAMNGQFAARPPGINYRFLRDTPGLIQLGTVRGYTLAQVRSS